MADAEGGGSQGEGRADAGTCRLSIDAGKVPDLILYMITEDGKDFVPSEGRRPSVSVRIACSWVRLWVLCLACICVRAHTLTTLAGTDP